MLALQDNFINNYKTRMLADFEILTLSNDMKLLIKTSFRVKFCAEVSNFTGILV